jgi:PAS domain S-box-containing protein
MLSSIIPELEMFRFFEMTPDLVCIASKDGYFLNVNSAVEKTLGYSREELFSRPISEFQHPDDKEITRKTRNELLNGKALINFDNRYIHKNGEIIWLNWTSIYIADKQIVFALAKNVTKRKHEEELIQHKYQQFRDLATHFKQSLETDKKFLAAELHEQLAQLATAVKVDLNWISGHVQLDDAARERVSHASAISQMLVDGIRKISYDISPSMIEDMGLNETLSWLCNEFAKINNISCSYNSEVDDSVLSREVQIDLYRICQKLLKNVEDRNDDSASVRIRLFKDTEHQLCLSINDDKLLLDTDELASSPALAGMHERIASIHGVLNIQRTHGKGTTLNIKIPVLTEHKPGNKLQE